MLLLWLLSKYARLFLNWSWQKKILREMVKGTTTPTDWESWLKPPLKAILWRVRFTTPTRAHLRHRCGTNADLRPGGQRMRSVSGGSLCETKLATLVPHRMVPDLRNLSSSLWSVQGVGRVILRLLVLWEWNGGFAILPQHFNPEIN